MNEEQIEMMLKLIASIDSKLNIAGIFIIILISIVVGVYVAKWIDKNLYN